MSSRKIKYTLYSYSLNLSTETFINITIFRHFMFIFTLSFYEISETEKNAFDAFLNKLKQLLKQLSEYVKHIVYYMKRNKVTFIMTLLFFLAETLECYSCNNISNISTCNGTTHCSSGQVVVIASEIFSAF